MYYSEDNYPGGFFQYNKDPNSQIYVIRRYDRETGNFEFVTGGNGGAARPQVSPDGEHLAFVRRVRTKSVLYVRELSSGLERPIYQNLSKDQQEAWAIFGVYTGFNWTPDSKEIIIWANGKINRINVETGNAQEIPFVVESNHEIVKMPRFKQEVAPETFRAKAIRNAITSPDGKTLVFNAAGYLWIKEMPNGTPKRLTSASHFEFDPSFSKDGRYLTYVSWSDLDMGAIHIVDLQRRGRRGNINEPVKITSKKGIYREPAFSPDGETIVFRRESGNGQQGFAYTVEPGIYTIPASGGDENKVINGGSFPRFSADGTRIFYQGGGYLFGAINKSYNSVDLNGNDEKTHFTSSYAHKLCQAPTINGSLFRIYIKCISHH